jgi:hypothetical protein
LAKKAALGAVETRISFVKISVITKEQIITREPQSGLSEELRDHHADPGIPDGSRAAWRTPWIMISVSVAS